MRIVIVGDGKVGYTLAEQLSQEQHDVTIIDKNASALRRADDALDVLCIQGNGASIRTLQEADVEHTDVLIAATTSDEMNMVCCLMGRRLGVKHTVARIRDPEYIEELPLLKQEIGLDLVINPEEAAANEVARLLRFPNVHAIESFARGRVEMIAFRVHATDPVCGKPLSKFTLPHGASILFCAVEHDGEVIIPSGTTVLHADDIVHIIGQPTATSAFFKFLGRNQDKVRLAMIIGGGRISYYLARALIADGIAVKIIEIDPDVAHRMGDALPDALIIRGDGMDQAVLQSEGLEKTDAFVSLTDRDEENLMVALYARQCGVPKVVTKINRFNYTDIIRQMGIDSVITPKAIAANRIVRYVRGLVNSQGSAIETLYRIIGGQAEAIEFEAKDSSRLVGHTLRELPLKPGVLIATLAREGKIIIPRGDDIIEPGDHVIAIIKGLSVVDLDDILEDRE